MNNAQEIIQSLADRLSFNWDDLDLNTPKGREEFLYRFLISKKYSKTAVAVLMAQANHETAGFKYMKELGSPNYLSRYDNRKDLGHSGQPGIGAKYRGRGYIQLTGKNNYTMVGNYLGIDLTNYPEIVENPVVGAYVFDWFINHGNRFKSGTNVAHWAEEGDIVKTTLLINGGRNGLNDRIAKHNHYKKRLGI